jgi:hypothetical protein
MVITHWADLNPYTQTVKYQTTEGKNSKIRMYKTVKASVGKAWFM